MKHGTHAPNVPGMTSQWIEVNNIRLHYVQGGDPIAALLVLLHGFPESQPPSGDPSPDGGSDPPKKLGPAGDIVLWCFHDATLQCEAQLTELESSTRLMEINAMPCGRHKLRVHTRRIGEGGTEIVHLLSIRDPQIIKLALAAMDRGGHL